MGAATLPLDSLPLEAALEIAAPLRFWRRHPPQSSSSRWSWSWRLAPPLEAVVPGMYMVVCRVLERWTQVPRADLKGIIKTRIIYTGNKEDLVIIPTFSKFLQNIIMNGLLSATNLQLINMTLLYVFHLHLELNMSNIYPWASAISSYLLPMQSQFCSYVIATGIPIRLVASILACLHLP